MFQLQPFVCFLKFYLLVVHYFWVLEFLISSVYKSFVIYSFRNLCLLWGHEGILAHLYLPNFSRRFIFLIFMFRSIICLKLIYMHEMRINSVEIHCFPCLPSWSSTICWTFLSLWIVLEPLSKINRQYVWFYFWTLFGSSDLYVYLYASTTPS